MLRYPKASLILFVPLTGVFGFALIFNALGGNRINSYFVAVSVPLILTAVGLYVVVEFAAVTVVLTADSVRYLSPWRGPREVRWKDVIAATYSSHGYALRTRTQGAIHISSMLKGSSVLPIILKDHGIELER